MQCFIQVEPVNKVTLFAGRELKKYLDKMAGEFTVGLCTGKFPKGKRKILLKADASCFSVKDAELDDAYKIDVKNGEGVITASNPRAVLLGVYRLLTEAGCRFIRPGENGEVIPNLPLSELSVSLCDSASFRHRGVVIEGADSVENILDIIDWMMKLGYNSFFTQLKSLDLFFDRYYNHKHNMLLADESPNEDTRELYGRMVTDAMAKRGILHHAMGHGWTCEAIGVDESEWGKTIFELSDDIKAMTALVNGERGIKKDNPNMTNLCYSNPKVRRKIVDRVLIYAKAHPDTSALHFWLADGTNNHCECDECRKKNPSDWYVTLLNELDERLTEEKLSTKIVFLIYQDLLFPPKEEKIKNKDRFILMFAPFDRSFSKSFADFTYSEHKPEPYILNNTSIPESLEDTFALLQEWKKSQDWESYSGGDSFDFDYHLGRAHYGDPGYCAISKVICRDASYLPKMELNGILCCQELRAFFPTSLPSYSMGKMLWNKNLSYEEIADEYFKSAFGENYAAARSYLEAVSECFDVDYWLHGMPKSSPRTAENAEKALFLAIKMKQDIKNINIPEEPCQRLSWQYLSIHTEYLTAYANMVRCKADGDDEKAGYYKRELSDILRLNESSLQRVMDVFRLLDLMSVDSETNLIFE